MKTQKKTKWKNHRYTDNNFNPKISLILKKMWIVLKKTYWKHVMKTKTVEVNKIGLHKGSQSCHLYCMYHLQNIFRLHTSIYIVSIFHLHGLHFTFIHFPFTTFNFPFRNIIFLCLSIFISVSNHDNYLNYLYWRIITVILYIFQISVFLLLVGSKFVFLLWTQNTLNIPLFCYSSKRATY